MTIVTIVTSQDTHVINVDTHANPGTAAMLALATGPVVDIATFTARLPSIARPTGWIGRRYSAGQV
ncbi:hypothetical protein AOC05_00450 [Arthrobacter alpinus]|uniref:Uncharacterized protein n=1 Tax=Arthrobacter alpinus TaxID=656366 RepID=A0A0M5M168_9MICC|nr:MULTISPECIES: hypothetical protein [Arthrobacter]ALE91187.1 hypothetical protein AOC05_00450 [Arthrobacter alpinus]